MLTITIPQAEFFNDELQEFITTKSYELRLEHSLISLAKWEAKWLKPFLTTKDKTIAETIDYVRCMTITQNVDPLAYNFIPSEVMSSISEYIDSPMTATTFSQQANKATNKEVITAEIIYYWMIAFTIPFECQTWHLNRLLTLINVCSIKNQPKGKFNRKEHFLKQKTLNEQRKQQLNTRG